MKKRITRFVCSFCMMLLMAAHAQAEHKGGIVLVLSGGAMRGLAHIGVLQALEEKNIPIVGIVGTSMGSIIGGLAASGHSPEEILEVVETLDLGNLMSEQATPIFVPSGDSDARLNQIPWAYMNKKGNVTGPLGGLTGVKLLEKFAQLASRVQIVHFDDLPIPFAAVATDLDQTVEATQIFRHALANQASHTVGVGEQVFFFHAGQRGQRGTAGQRIATEGRTVITRPEQPGRLAPCQTGTDRHTGRQPLGQRGHIRLHAGQLVTEPLPGTTHAALHLIAHHQPVVGIANRAHPLVIGRVGKVDAAFALNDFKQHRHDVLVVLGDRFQRVQITVGDTHKTSDQGLETDLHLAVARR